VVTEWRAVMMHFLQPHAVQQRFECFVRIDGSAIGEVPGARPLPLKEIGYTAEITVLWRPRLRSSKGHRGHEKRNGQAARSAIHACSSIEELLHAVKSVKRPTKGASRCWRTPMPSAWHCWGSGHSRRIGERQRLAVGDRDVERERVEAIHATEVDAVTVMAVLASNGSERGTPWSDLLVLWGAIFLRFL
jgi:hypothetical protein